MPPASWEPSDLLRDVIKRALLATAGTPLSPSPSLNDELTTLQGRGLLPMWVSVEQFRELWADVERELQDEVHASRAMRRAL